LLSKTPHNISLEELKSLASQMHGYVGADIAGSAIVREVGTIAIRVKRWLNTFGQEQISQLSRTISLKLMLQDIVSAIPFIRPSVAIYFRRNSPSEIFGHWWAGLYDTLKYFSVWELTPKGSSIVWTAGMLQNDPCLSLCMRKRCQFRCRRRTRGIDISYNAFSFIFSS
jgi:hypothetical protein